MNGNQAVEVDYRTMYYENCDHERFPFPDLTASEEEAIAAWTVYSDASFGKIIATIVEAKNMLEPGRTVTLYRAKEGELVRTEHKSFEEAMVTCFLATVIVPSLPASALEALGINIAPVSAEHATEA